MTERREGPALERLTAAQAAEIVAVFCDAFRDYPVMRYITGPPGDDHARLHHLINFFVGRRVQQGGPLLGIVENGRLLAAATMTLPNEPKMPPSAAALRDETWRQLGDDARARYETYAERTKALAIPAPHHHLNMIGVRTSHQGQKLARPLLDAVRSLAEADPDSSGVSLTTETTPNLTLYRHFGYEVQGHVRVAPDLESWGLFLRCR
jgi:GNAT superfamily N-acetyltransferase